MLKKLNRKQKSFALLFSVELWERWAYYGMQALLALYFVKQEGYTDQQAYAIFAAFSALLYIFPSYGGFLCDRLIGAKRTLIIGASILCAGYGVLAFHLTKTVFFPLALIVVGGGVFKPNPSRLVSKIYEKSSSALSSAFTIFYMSINVGSLLSMGITPIVAKYYGFHAAFALSFIGMLTALINYLFMRGLLQNVSTKAGRSRITLEKLYIVATSLAGLVGISYWLIQHYDITALAIILGGIAILLYTFKESLNCTSAERKRLLLGLLLIGQAIIFFIIYFQMPTTMTLFALRNSTHYLVGIPVSPASFELLNPFWIIVLSPILAFTYVRLGGIGKDLSIPMKFALGTISAGLGILAMPLGAMFAKNGIMNGNWFILAYALQSLGELLVSALGLAMVAIYMPKRMAGFAMGAWFMCSAVAGILSGKGADIASVPKNITNPILSLPIYTHYYILLGGITVAIGIAIFLLVPLLQKLDAEVELPHHFQNIEADTAPE